MINRSKKRARYKHVRGSTRAAKHFCEYYIINKQLYLYISLTFASFVSFLYLPHILFSVSVRNNLNLY